jgi:hypothetical protein
MADLPVTDRRTAAFPRGSYLFGNERIICATGLPFAAYFAMSTSASLYPSASILTAWCERDWQRADGVQLERLEHMQRVVMRTYQHAYEMFVRCGPTGDVLVRGGHFFQDFTEAKLAGSSLGGGFLKQFGIYVSLRVEFHINGETVLTAPVFSISIGPAELT